MNWMDRIVLGLALALLLCLLPLPYGYYSLVRLVGEYLHGAQHTLQEFGLLSLRGCEVREEAESLVYLSQENSYLW